jgi:predicted metal-dependent peptidase
MNMTTQTQAPPADQAEVENKVGKAKSLLILDHPFFGTAVSRRPIIYTDSVPTAAMAATGQMYINPAFAAPLSVKQLMFLLAHEALHYMLSHATRRGHRDAKAWNVAADKVINDTLIDAGVGEFIDGGIYLRDARQYAAEELYDENDNNGGQGPGGTGNDVQDPVDENGNPLDDSKVHEIEARAKIEAVQCAKAAKAVGKLPGAIERMVDQIVNVDTPWDDILERFMTAKIKDGYSWNRPNRRFIANNMYLPGTDYKPKMGPVVIGVDTSGSIGQAELNEFAAHTNRILDLCGPEKVIVVYCDAAVAHVDEYTPDEFPVQLTPHGGGGTDLTKVFDWVAENGEEPEMAVMFTDGYTPFGDAPGFDVVWAMTTQETAPYGESIHVEFRNG